MPSKEEIQLLRKRCQTDLWFLARNVLKKDIVETAHRPITDFFIKKDPCKPIHAQEEIKRRLLLYPRGSFKSTLNVVDVVQWIICFPDISIQIVTAAEDLAVAFVEEVKEYFTIHEGAEPTEFQQLFEEHCVQDNTGKADEFTTPGRTKYRKEPSVKAFSLYGSLPGFHCDVMKFDDVVIDKNSETEALRDKTKRKIKSARKLIKPFCYLDIVGTRWHPDDYYGEVIDKLPEGEWKFLCEPAWKLLPHAKHKLPENLTEQDYTFLFPVDASGTPQLNFKFLRSEQADDPKGFAYQYLNDVKEGAELEFDHELLLAHTRPPQNFPDGGGIYAAFDLALTTGSQSDYTSGVVARIDDSGIYLLDIIHGRFNTTELVYQIVNVCKIWQPKHVAIEEIAGSDAIKQAIQRQAMSAHVATPLFWFKPDNSYDAKNVRIKSLHPLLTGHRLWFANNMLHLEKLYEQLERWTGERGKKRKDDLPDAVSFLLKFVKGSVQHRQLTLMEKEQRAEAQQAALYRALYPNDAPLEEIDPQEQPPVIQDESGLDAIFNGLREC